MLYVSDILCVWSEKSRQSVLSNAKCLEICSSVRAEWLSLDFHCVEAGYVEFSLLWLGKFQFQFQTFFHSFGPRYHESESLSHKVYTAENRDESDIF